MSSYLGNILEDLRDLREVDFDSPIAEHEMTLVIEDQDVELPKRNPERGCCPRVRYQTAKGINRRGFFLGTVMRRGEIWYRLCRRLGDGRIFLRTESQIEFIR